LRKQSWVVQHMTAPSSTGIRMRTVIASVSHAQSGCGNGGSSPQLARIQFGLRYGATPVEIQKGRNAVEVAKLEDLPATINLLMKAVTEGELDDAIRFAATSRAPKLKRKAA
jgi:hypothetical protein